MDEHARALAESRRRGARGGRRRTRARTRRSIVSPRELPGLARGDEAAAELERERAAEDEPARLGAEDRGPACAARRTRPGRSTAVAERLRVGEQRHDVLEDDPGLAGSPGCRGSSLRGRRLMDAASLLRRASGARARRGAARAPARRRRASRGLRCPRCAARGSASGAPARRSARAAPPSTTAPLRNARRLRGSMPKRGEPRSTRPRSRRRAPGSAPRRPRRRGSRIPKSSSSRTKARVGARRARRASRRSIVGSCAESGPPSERRRVRRLRAGRHELVANHAQRQELVALEPQDRPQPLDVVVASRGGSRSASRRGASRPWPSR